jgi:hypothetical protein
MRMRYCLGLSVILLASFLSLRAEEPPCGVAEIKETKPLLYPPIARAAHVTGEVILMVQFSMDGSVHAIDTLSGPEMLRASAKDFVSGWSANIYGGSRACPIAITYEIGDTEKNDGVERTDTQHYGITAYPICLCDPPADIGRRKRFFIF